MNAYRKLTSKELEALKLLAQGYIVKEAADIFGVTTKAVDFRIVRLRKKLGVPQHVSTQSILPILALNTERIVPFVNTNNPPTDLTERQREILAHITTGLRQSKVAKLLHLSENTAETHMGAIRRLVRNRLGRDRITIVELTHYAIAHRITPLQFTERCFCSQETPHSGAAVG